MTKQHWYSTLASKMVQLSPALTKIVRIVPSGKRLLGLNLNTEFRALAADGRRHTAYRPCWLSSTRSANTRVTV